jgi:hypothetical protein
MGHEAASTFLKMCADGQVHHHPRLQHASITNRAYQTNRSTPVHSRLEDASIEGADGQDDMRRALLSQASARVWVTLKTVQSGW